MHQLWNGWFALNCNIYVDDLGNSQCLNNPLYLPTDIWSIIFEYTPSISEAFTNCELKYYYYLACVARESQNVYVLPLVLGYIEVLSVCLLIAFKILFDLRLSDDNILTMIIDSNKKEFISLSNWIVIFLLSLLFVSLIIHIYGIYHNIKLIDANTAQFRASKKKVFDEIHSEFAENETKLLSKYYSWPDYDDIAQRHTCWELYIPIQKWCNILQICVTHQRIANTKKYLGCKYIFLLALLIVCTIFMIGSNFAFDVWNVLSGFICVFHFSSFCGYWIYSLDSSTLLLSIYDILLLIITIALMIITRIFGKYTNSSVYIDILAPLACNFIYVMWQYANQKYWCIRENEKKQNCEIQFYPNMYNTRFWRSIRSPGGMFNILCPPLPIEISMGIDNTKHDHRLHTVTFKNVSYSSGW